MLLIGCSKANYVPVEGGRFQLLATGTAEKAMIRIRRRAEDLCPHGYDMTPLKIIAQGVEAGANPYFAVSETTQTWEAYVSCR